MFKKQFKKLLLIAIMTGASSITKASQNTSLNCDQMQTSNDKNIRECFIGTWKLVSNMKKEGNVITYPYGKDAVGYITYNANGYMSVQMMEKNRTKPIPGYFAYFGRYEIDKKTHVVHHYLTGSLTPSEVGTDRSRSYQFIGDQLHLVPVEEKNREIIWGKIK